jgi:predicted DNA-binding ribbon-helix-helix protein
MPFKDTNRRKFRRHKGGMRSWAQQAHGFHRRHQTSINLEAEFWTALKEIADERREIVKHLISSIDADRRSDNLSSVLRVFVLEYYKDRFVRQRATFEISTH